MHDNHILVQILILLMSAVITVPLFRYLKLGTVLGYLIAGAVVGPWGLGLITAVDDIRHIAEFGVIFLLFLIGVELKPSRLWRMRRLVFGVGSLQVVLTGLLLTLVAHLLGLEIRTAIIKRRKITPTSAIWRISSTA